LRIRIIKCEYGSSQIDANPRPLVYRPPGLHFSLQASIVSAHDLYGSILSC
jgi:hypothetical protein